MQEQIQYINPENIDSGIYKLTAPDGSFYIGSSCEIRNRWSCHQRHLLKNKHKNPRVQNKFNSKPQGWTFTIIENVNTEDLLIAEQKHLDIHFGAPLCMNNNKIAGKPPSMKNVKHSAEFAKNISIRQSGQKLSAEWSKAESKGVKESWDRRHRLQALRVNVFTCF